VPLLFDTAEDRAGADAVPAALNWVADPYMLAEMLFSVLEMDGCRNLRATITRIAISARMRAYSTKP